jgi:hypothetical protein
LRYVLRFVYTFPVAGLSARKAGVGFVYFIQAEDGGLIKIGWALNPAKRLRDLQIGSPVKLKILATVEGRRADEAWLHRVFHDSRRHGEWFETSDDLEKIMRGEGWPVRMPVQLDLDGVAPNPNDVDMTFADWMRRKRIEEMYHAGMSEAHMCVPLNWKRDRLRKELQIMAKLGYFRGVRLNLRSQVGRKGQPMRAKEMRPA